MCTHLFLKTSLIFVLSSGVLASCNRDKAEVAIPASPIIEKIEAQLSPAEIDANMPEFYDSEWAVTDGWPGEYPNGFSILKDGIVLKAHSRMHPSTPARIDCPVPKFATYQLWNNSRYEEEQWDFQVATKIYDITITKDVAINAYDETLPNNDKKLKLVAGDKLTYQRYLGEGFAIVTYKGREIQIDESEIHDASDLDNTDTPVRGGEDLWLELPCADDTKTRAWVLYDEVIQQDGVVPTPIIGYGESRDITEDDIAGILEMIELNTQSTEN